MVERARQRAGALGDGAVGAERTSVRNGLWYVQGDGLEGRSPMDTAKVRSLAQEILALPEQEHQAPRLTGRQCCLAVSAHAHADAPSNSHASMRSGVSCPSANRS